ncbi:MAG: LuxR C-terminal-related transcriptional regulator, partial [Actinomycetota bacterium]
LYLAALSLQDRAEAGRFVETFAGDNRHVVDYLTPEVLNKQPKPVRRFLIRTSILDRLTASLCDAVVGTGGSKAMLDELEHSNLFLVSMDSRRRWFRYHRLFRELLRSELQRLEPDSVRDLHRRASAWHRMWGFLEEAIAHAIAADDVPAARELIGSNWFTYWEADRLGEVHSWLDGLGKAEVESDAALALVAAWEAGLSGRHDDFEHWLTIAEPQSFEGPLPDGTSSLQSGLALIRSLLGRAGVAAALEAARRAAELEIQPDSRWRRQALGSLGYYLYLSGNFRGAIEPLNELSQQSAGGRDGVIFARALLSMIALEDGRVSDARELARESQALVDDMGVTDNPTTFAVCLAQGLVSTEDANLAAAAGELGRALELGRLVPWLQPWPTLQGLLALAHAYSAQGDLRGASALMVEAKSFLKKQPDAGILARQYRRLEESLETAARNALGEPLTQRELSVLRLLPSSLTQREIGGQLYLSINTVKSHSRSIYRKLGVDSRDHAVARARELGLIKPKARPLGDPQASTQPLDRRE